MTMLRVAIGSRNPVKFNAVCDGFKAVWPRNSFDLTSFKFPSCVSEQPMSNKEMLKGALYIAENALCLWSTAQYGAGLESGAYKIGKHWFETGCVVIVDRKGKIGIGFTISMEIPEKVLKLVKKGNIGKGTLGEAMDFVFKTK